jgi:hypothetical protein
LDKIHSAYEEAQADLQEDMTSIAEVENIAAMLKLPFLSASDNDSEDLDCYTDSDLE